ncbi:MAG: hypothetical protein IID45_02505 [Planctomycetes bacterium]|nr:hypothetical protein [Planctomycetota bacterium]
MSLLKLWTEENPLADDETLDDESEPVVLSFCDYADGRRNRYRADPLTRARVLRKNDCCPQCRRSLIEPLELSDGRRTRNDLPIPGTATLVGFRCLCCHWEWPVHQRAVGFTG